MWRPTRGCVVPLEVSGDRPALYCVHALGGTVAYYAPVARLLGGVRDVYGLQSHGISPGHEPDRTIEAMAGRYVDAVTAVQPEGPYEILGYSMGGFIAFEMARQFELRGERVRLVGLIDTDPPHVRTAPLTTVEALSLVSRAVGLFPPFAGDPSLPESEQAEAFLARAIEAGRLPSTFELADLKPMIDIYVVNGEACAAYQPDAIFGSIRCLFTRRPDVAVEQLVEEWRDYVDGAVDVDVIEADHHALMHEQHADQVADVVLRWITRGAYS